MKRISPATVTVGVVAILFGLVAAYTVRRYLEPPAAPAPAMAMIVVPRVNLPKYARIREQDVDVHEVPADQVPAGALAVTSRALHRLCRDTILAGRPILEQDLYEVGAVPTLADELPPGYRAVTVSVDRDNAVDGLVMPESVVDVSMTVEGDHPDLQGVATVTLMRGVRVLATNFNRFRGEERLNQPMRSVTLAVTPEQANKLILAQRYGSLSVTLRSTADDVLVAQQAPADNDNLVHPDDLLKLTPRETKIVRRAEIWRGDAVEEILFEERQILEAQAATSAAERTEVRRLMPTAFERDRPAARATEPVVVPSDPTARLEPTPGMNSTTTAADLVRYFGG